MRKKILPAAMGLRVSLFSKLAVEVQVLSSRHRRLLTSKKVGHSKPDIASTLPVDLMDLSLNLEELVSVVLSLCAAWLRPSAMLRMDPKRARTAPTYRVRLKRVAFTYGICLSTRFWNQLSLFKVSWMHHKCKCSCSTSHWRACDTPSGYKSRFAECKLACSQRGVAEKTETRRNFEK